MTHSKDLHTVVARYQEDISWINNLETPYTVYNKGSLDLKLNYIPLENIGRESHTYLTYILDNYNNLPQYVTFLQGDPFAHCKNVIEIINNFNKDQELDVVCLTDSLVTDDRNGCPHHCGLAVGSISDTIFKETQHNQFTFSGGAQYIVSSKSITSKSLEWWKKVYSIHNTHNQSPWIFERLWLNIWRYEEI